MHTCSWAKKGFIRYNNIPCDGVGHVPEHWKIRKTSVPFILMGEGGVGGSGYG